MHDANGSITGDGINTFTYDTKGRLVQASTALGTVTYQVNTLGQRYSKTLQGATTVYLYEKSGRLIAETADAGATYTQYVWLGDTPVAVLKPNTPTPARYYIHADHLDTPRVITDQNQAIRWRWDNDDPFGANMASENPSGLGNFAFNLRFPGQYFDKETNYHYNYFRDYSPEIGRYIESDPIGLAGGLNTYAYVYDPLNDIDPLGLRRWGAGIRKYADPPKPPPACDGRWVRYHWNRTAVPGLYMMFGFTPRCDCYWVCRSCPGQDDIYSPPPANYGRGVFSTSGRMYFGAGNETGSSTDPEAGDVCPCPRPGPEKGCNGNTCGDAK